VLLKFGKGVSFMKHKNNNFNDFLPIQCRPIMSHDPSLSTGSRDRFDDLTTSSITEINLFKIWATLTGGTNSMSSTTLDRNVAQVMV